MTLEQAKQQYPELLASFYEAFPDLRSDDAVKLVDIASKHLDWDRLPNHDMTEYRF